MIHFGTSSIKFDEGGDDTALFSTGADVRWLVFILPFLIKLTIFIYVSILLQTHDGKRFR